MMLGYNKGGYDIKFTTHGYNFSLNIPVINNITLDDYLRKGPYAFQLCLRYEKNPSYCDWIDGTFDENNLKDILDKWLKEKEETNESGN